MCSVVMPKQPKISRSDARVAVKKTIEESKRFHKSIREGHWHSNYDIDIVTKSK